MPHAWGMSGPIRAIRYLDVLEAPNAQALLSAYSSECSLPAIGQPDPQPQMYEALERAGVFQVFGAYLGDDLIGFASVIVSVLPHYGRKVATMESLFVAPECREEGIGLHLLAQVERYATEAGCGAILYSAPSGGQLEKLLSLLKSYEHTNTIFCRRLT